MPALPRHRIGPEYHEVQRPAQELLRDQFWQLADSPLPLPPVEEQGAIVRVVSASSTAIAEEHQGQLERAKSAPSAALLTGRIKTVHNPILEAP